MRHSTWIVALATMFCTAPALAQDAYVVGLSGAITGANADTYAPGVESIVLYVERLNKRGGVNGKPVRLIVGDNQGEPSKAAADAKKFISQDQAVLLVNVGLSSSYAPMVAEAGRANVPLLFAGAACPAEVLPPKPHALQFCSISSGMKYDVEMALRFIREQSGQPAKIGLAAMAIPVSRAGIDYAESLAPKLGLTSVGKELIPPTAPNYMPFASNLKDGQADWVFSWAPWVTEVKTFEALRKVGWSGRYIAAALNPAEDELARVKDEGFYGFGANAMFLENLPVHQEIREAAGSAKVTYPLTQMAEGWVAGMVIEEALKNVAWPPTPEKVLAAMNTLKVDTRGLRGGPIEWSKTNHFRSQQHYRVYRWDAKSQAVVRVQDWVTLDVQ